MTLTFKDSVPYGAESGIVILKKIPKGHQKNKYKGEDSAIPEFKPLKTDESDEFTFKNIVGKFFHASTSLQPDEPTEHETETSDDTDETVEPPAVDEALEKPYAPYAYSNYDYSQPYKASPSTSYHQYLTLLNKKPNTFENVDYETHPELYEDTKTEQNPETPSSAFKLSQAEIDFLKNYLLKHNESQIANTTIGTSSSLKTTKYKPSTVSSPENLPSIESFPPYPGELPADFMTKYGQQLKGYALQTLPFGGFKLNPPANPFEGLPPNSIDPRYKHYHPLPSKQNLRYASPQKLRPVRLSSKRPPPPPRSLRPKSPKVSPPVRVVKSLTYELGPNGPIRV